MVASSNITGTYPLSGWHSLISRCWQVELQERSQPVRLALHRGSSTSKSEAPTLEFRPSEPLRIFAGALW